MAVAPTPRRSNSPREAQRQGWPHDYEELVRRVKQRVPSLKQNKAFYEALNELRPESRLARVRLLDINNPKSSKKTYYSDAMVASLLKMAAT